MDEIKLKPCPHCGPRNVEPDLYDDEMGHGFWKVGCGGCGSHSGISKDKQRVIDLWNRRPAEEIDMEWNLYHDSENRSQHDIKRIEQLEEYIRKMADPNNEFYVSHYREYEVKELDGTTRTERVGIIKNIQQMAKDAKKALGK